MEKASATGTRTSSSPLVLLLQYEVEGCSTVCAGFNRTPKFHGGGPFLLRWPKHTTNREIRTSLVGSFTTVGGSFTMRVNELLEKGDRSVLVVREPHHQPPVIRESIILWEWEHTTLRTEIYGSREPSFAPPLCWFAYAPTSPRLLNFLRAWKDPARRQSICYL